MIRCVAIDDEPLALRQIVKYIEKIPDLELITTCRNAAEAQQVLAENDVELIFVDINMPGRSGLDLVRGLETQPMVIFTTAYSEYAVEGFRLDAVDYLLKPFSFADFKRAVDKAMSLHELMRLRDEYESQRDESAGGDDGDNADVAETADATVSDDTISIKADYKVSIVRYADIIYIESVGEYVRLHLVNAAPITTLFRLKNMESTLPSDRFMRVHRSYIVNLSHVTGYGRGRVFLSNDEYVSLGANYRDAFREYIDRKKP